ncbi:unnamed protein product [Hermetia illucens]|uniref:Alcohol dehydrogenase n=1 Tax=Hermetia illucens TaxID=343691 RepID=A0A7R8UX85_HERIL|nr:alcohol dehydrogenase 1-like isoform X1 [Hermetia illucens]XP_037915407.1 alcohol dehydrogenase 1-like isoform X1 [Hermetia illucens]CAD7088795.1 unnamed protein product [Hermetia illucens]
MVVDITGLKAAISGGFGGIGQAICKELLEQGILCLTILDLKEASDSLEAWRKAYPKQKIFFNYIDVAKRSVVEESMRAAKEKMGGLDIFVNCSGISKEADPELCIQVNLLGIIYTSLTAIDLMGKHKGGNGGIVVNVVSVLGLEPCHPVAIYTASKHGGIGFTRSISHEFHYDKTGIAFIAACPGLTNTKLIEDAENAATFDYLKDEMVRIMKAKSQEADICGKNIVKAMRTGKNGSIWICDLGTLRETEMPVHWSLQF